MASRRKFSRVLQALLQSNLQIGEDERRSELVRRRQLELAEQNDAYRRGQAEDARAHQILTKLTDDPTGRTALGFQEMGMSLPQGFNLNAAKDRAANQAFQDYSTKMSGTKLDELPDDVTMQSQFQSIPGADAPRDIQTLVAQREAQKKAQLAGIERDIKTEGRKKFVTNEQGVLGTEAGDKAVAPAKLERTKAETRALTPLFAARAGAETRAREAAQEPYRVSAEGRAHENAIKMANHNRKLQREELPPGIIPYVAAADASLSALDQMDLLYREVGSKIPENIGPIAGRIAKTKEGIPVWLPGAHQDPTVSKFIALEATAINNLIKSTTGAQMAEVEAVRIMQQAARMQQNNASWEERMKVWREMAEESRQGYLKYSMHPAAGKPRDTGRQTFGVDAQGNLVPKQ